MLMFSICNVLVYHLVFLPVVIVCTSDEANFLWFDLVLMVSFEINEIKYGKDNISISKSSDIF